MRLARYFIICIGLFSVCAYGIETSIISTENQKIPISYINNLPIVKLNIFGKERSLLVDTGAQDTFLALSTDILNKQNLHKYKTPKFSNVIGEITETKEYFLDELIVQNIKLEDIRVSEWYNWAFHINDNSSNYDETDGALGCDFFLKVPSILDFRHNTFVIMPTITEIQDRFRGRKVIEINFTLDNGISIPLRLCKTCRDFWFVFDTGATHNVVDSKITSVIPDLILKKEDGVEYFYAKMLYKDHKVDQTRVYTIPNAHIQSILGMSTISKMVVYFDITNMKIIIGI